MYINDYSNRWSELFGSDTIEIDSYSSDINVATGYGYIATALPTTGNWASYRGGFRSALLNATPHSVTSVSPFNASAGNTDYMPILKLVGRTSGLADLYVKFPIRFNFRDASQVFFYGAYESPSQYTGDARFAYTTFKHSTSDPISSLCATSVDVADTLSPGITSGSNVREMYLYGDYDWFLNIDAVYYKAIYDDTNGVLGIALYMEDTETPSEMGIEDGEEPYTSTSYDEFYFYLGAMANSYGIETNQGGIYPVPTSDIPLRDSLNPYGTNFKTSIDVYDETNVDANAMFLENYVGTLAYTFVRFSEPSGTIRCATTMQFTHFVTRSFTDSDTPRVYRVTGRRVVNVNVIEYDFTLDYLKDYWQHFGITSTNRPILYRSTDSDDFNKYINDEMLPYSGTFTEEEYSTYSVSAMVAIVFNFPYSDVTGREDGIQAIAITFAEFVRFIQWWNNDSTVQSYQSKLASYINGIYAIPYSTIGSDIYITTYSSISLPLPESGSVVYTASDAIYIINTGNRLTTDISNYVYGQIDCSGIDMADCRYFHGNATAHIPFYGDIPIPQETLVKIDTASVLTFKYVLNLNDGSVALSFSPYTEVQPAIALPSLALPLDTSAQAIRQFDREKYVSYATGIINAAINPASIASSAGGLAQIENRRQNLVETAGRKSHTSTGMISLYQQPTLKFELPDLAIDIDDYYPLVGYPCMKLWQYAVSGNRYWIEISAGLCGTKEYIEGVKNAINGVGIVYNY